MADLVNIITAYDEAWEQAGSRKGDCYRLAASHLLYDEAPEGSLLVHGQASFMPSHLPCLPFDHAWVEYPDGRVYEPISQMVLTPAEWEAIGRVAYWAAEADKQGWPWAERRYDKETTRQHVLDETTWGPWLPLWETP